MKVKSIGNEGLASSGTKKVKYVEENAAATVIMLTPEELKKINDEFPDNAAEGLRYPEAMMKTVNQ